MTEKYGELKVFYGSSNPKLGAEICEELEIECGKILIKKFANDETYIQFQENVRDKDVFLLQTASKPINDNFVELLIMIDAAKRSSAGRITVVMPSYFYARQDRKAASREPISARLVADLLEKAGADRTLVLELHSDQIQGFFNIPLDNLSPKRIFIKKARELFPNKKENVIIAPDAGAAKKSTKISKTLDCGLGIINKVRTKHNEANALNIIGEDVEGKNCLIFDDMLDTGGSLCVATKMLKDKGAKKIVAFITHGIFSGDAIKKIEESNISKIYVTNTLPQNTKSEKIEVLSVANYFAEAIKCIHKGESVSTLFDKGIKTEK
jgi:ribose-phosphate pyrophosphokinase